MKKEKVLELVQQALDIKTPVSFEDSSETLEPWDSLAQLQILMRIDQETGGKAANIPELAIALSVKAIIETLDKNNLIEN